MKRIGIYLERKPDAGGAYQYCLSMLNALSNFPKNQYEITAFYVNEGWIHELEKRGIASCSVKKNYIQKIAHVIMSSILPIELYQKFSRWIHPLAKALKFNKIEYCIFPCGDTVSCYMDTVRICTVFDLMHRYLKEFPEISDEQVFKSREKNTINICSYADLILVDSKTGKSQLLESYKGFSDLAERVKILPFIAPDYIYKSLQSAAYGRIEELPEKYIFYPAQFWMHKNHKNLLLAIASLRNEGIIVNLVLCGSPKNGYNLIKSIIDSENLQEQVRILNYVENEKMVSLYKFARALIMPTYAGPTNIPQLEAFLLECPVATSDIFGIPEQVGDAALLFNPDSVEEIAQSIKKLWLDDELCQLLKRKGKEQAKRWGQKEFTQNLLRYIDGLAENTHS